MWTSTGPLRDSRGGTGDSYSACGHLADCSVSMVEVRDGFGWDFATTKSGFRSCAAGAMNMQLSSLVMLVSKVNLQEKSDGMMEGTWKRWSFKLDCGCCPKQPVRSELVMLGARMFQSPKRHQRTFGRSGGGADADASKHDSPKPHTRLQQTSLDTTHNLARMIWKAAYDSIALHDEHPIPSSSTTFA